MPLMGCRSSPQKAMPSCSVASALAYVSLSLPTFCGGRTLPFGPLFRHPNPSRVLSRVLGFFFFPSVPVRCTLSAQKGALSGSAPFCISSGDSPQGYGISSFPSAGLLGSGIFSLSPSLPRFDSHHRPRFFLCVWGPVRFPLPGLRRSSRVSPGLREGSTAATRG